jgi:hypothetical protein
VAGGGQWWRNNLVLQGGNTALLLPLPLLLHLRADGQQRVGVGQSGLPASSLGCHQGGLPASSLGRHQGGPPALALTLNSLPLCQMTQQFFHGSLAACLDVGCGESYSLEPDSPNCCLML